MFKTIQSVKIMFTKVHNYFKAFPQKVAAAWTVFS